MALTSLPLAKGKRHKEVFEGLGWVVRTEGNHIVLTHPHHPQVFLSIPNHPEVKRQTLKKIVRDAGLTDEQYAIFFRGVAEVAERRIEEEELFRETAEADGSSRVHCMTCCKEVCLSADPAEIASAKQLHLSGCTGPIAA
ncbi:MAG: type II toxin-antitoxin system HicA family toxin [Terracidiphilus sp.]